MDLGSSIRRRRTKGDNGNPSGGGASSNSSGWLKAVGQKTVLLVVVVLLTGFGAGYLVATEVFFPAPPAPAELSEVPDVRGMASEEAAQSLDAIGLVVGATFSVGHPTAPIGSVLGQSPLPGQGALAGGEVELTLSAGPEVRPVPDVTRLRGDRAATVLAASGFTVLVDSVESDEPAGRVTEILPEPGTELALPGEVRLAVSLGPPPFEMPNLVGMPEVEALAMLDSLGLVISDITTRLSLRDDGSVIEQEPEAAIMVELGSAVRLVVGESPLRRIREDHE